MSVSVESRVNYGFDLERLTMTSSTVSTDRMSSVEMFKGGEMRSTFL